MALRVFKISEYDHAAERKQFDAIRAMLEAKYADRTDPCLLIGNYNIEGVELDALLVTTGGFRILEFKNWGGQIVARENGSWTSDGLIIEGGAGRKTPYEQIRLNRSRVAKGLTVLLGQKVQALGATIIFGKKARIDTTQLSGTVKAWLSVCDYTRLSVLLGSRNRPVFEAEYIERIPALLRIEEFEVTKERGPEDSATLSEAYDPESSTNLFEDLEAAIRQVPNYQAVYQAYNRVFHKCLDLNSSATRLHFGGPFAKTDYLLKEHGASREMARHTNDTRVRLRKSSKLPVQDLEKYYRYDLRNLCAFIAFVYPRTQIPETLSALFPKEELPVFKAPLVGERLRVLVEQWDDQYVYGQSEESGEEELLKIDYLTNRTYDYDWSYLKNLFYKGAQLNLVRPRKEEGILYPELIVFEPDFLVDISSVARCFTNYAESPFVNLLNKITPVQATGPILLGNLAGQLLDEAIHQLPDARPYAQSIRDFYQDNALGLLTGGIDASFHSEAQKQKQNIAQAVYTELPNHMKHFDLKAAMVEPSFFSELLGLQGRMDYLQLDFRVLIEQKSGKGEFPYDNYVKPKQKEEHYVQLLLYMALIRYNFREIYERNKQELHAFLLYSKYTNSLLGLGFAPELIFRAMKIRNEIAWTEILYARPSGFRILESITPEKMNQKGASGRLWEDYQSKQIKGLVAPIHQASELEKAYYFRFMTFIANEHLLSKLGNKTKENSGFAAKWYDSLEEKLRAGNIYCGLTLLSPNDKAEGEIKSVTLRFSETKDNDMSNFRVGDIVILYPYNPGEEPDVRTTMVFRCTIEDLRIDTIQLALRAAQSDGRVFKREAGKLWAIEHDFLDSSYSSLYRGMHAFLSAPQERRDLLLFQREPEHDPSLALKGDYGAFNELASQVKRARDLFLIIGPPGTGKTSYGLLNTVKEELLEPKTNILLMAYTNRAIDEICGKLVAEGIDFIRIGTRLSCSPAYREYMLSAQVRDCAKMEELRQKLLSTRVFVGTTTALNANLSLFQLKSFSLAVIDEASQILEPHLIGLLSAHRESVPAIRKFVLIGDHKQLPAVVQQKPDVSRVQDALLNEILLTDCRLSLFERLLKKYRNNKNLTYLLTKQGRMHHDIALFPNYTFYNNALEEVPRPHQNRALPALGMSGNGIVDLLATRRVAFIAARTPEASSSSDKVNQVEADIIAATVVKIYEIEKESFDVNETVGVIVPYRNQIATIRNTIDKYGIQALHDITIDTVERYQGSQRKYIIYGFTIQKYYQLDFLTNNVFEDADGTVVDRKLNVAMTRAEEHLLMVGNPELLSNNFTFFKLIEFVRSRQGYFDIERDDYVAGRFQVPEYERVEAFDLSQATYTTTREFNAAYERHVLQPVKEGSGEEWPSKVFGYDMPTNLNAIGYGRMNFSNQITLFDDVAMSPERQVLLYCYYIMRQHYCSAKNLYESFGAWTRALIRSVDGRVRMIDIGCGPATCGLAFAEVFLPDTPNMVYTGVDISAAMKRMGARLLDDRFRDRLRYRMIESFAALDEAYWAGCSELPSLVVLNLSYFFSNITARFAERLAQQINDVMSRYPLNHYVIFVQHSDTDHQLNTYKVFVDNLSRRVKALKRERTSFAYVLNYKKRRLPFCFDLFVGGR